MTSFRRGREPRACGPAGLQSATAYTSHPYSRSSKTTPCGSGTDADKGQERARHHRLGSGSRRPTRGSSCDPAVAPNPSSPGHGRRPTRRKQTPGRDRRPHTPRVLCPLPRGGPSRPERAFGVAGRSGLRAQPLCTPGQVRRRLLPTNGGARDLPQHRQNLCPTVPGNI